MFVELNVTEDEELFYYYRNWQAYQNNKIHRATCGKCQYGTGSRANVNRGQNGVWIGPFSSLALCEQFVEQELHQEPNHCNLCFNQ